MRLAALVFAFLVTGSANAATIETLSTQPVPPPQIWTVPCTHTLTGEIVEGDAARLQAELDLLPAQDHDEKNFVLCISGPGGNLAEGLRIGEVIQANFLATYVPPNASCLSACAIAFMHGRVGFWETLMNLRVIHPTATLGFHAPRLNLPQIKGAVPGPMVDAAYNSAIETIAALSKAASSTVYDSRIALIPLSLLEAMLSTPPDEFHYVDTLHKAFLWDIEIHPAGLVQPAGFDPEVAEYELCLNADYETQTQSGGRQGYPDISANDVAMFKNYNYGRPEDLPAEYSYITIEGLFTIGCGLKFDTQNGFLTVRQYTDGVFQTQVGLPPIYLFSPKTRIRDLWPD
jgi:hypothetical protein